MRQFFGRIYNIIDVKWAPENRANARKNMGFGAVANPLCGSFGCADEATHKAADFDVASVLKRCCGKAPRPPVSM
jgi:hypothetical protein